MDLLFKRYASPFLILDQMIETNRLEEFISSVIEFNNEDKLWELYTHTVILHRKDWEEFKKKPVSQKMTHKELEATITTSQNILKNFNPQKGGDT